MLVNAAKQSKGTNKCGSSLSKCPQGWTIKNRKTVDDKEYTYFTSGTPYFPIPQTTKLLKVKKLRLTQPDDIVMPFAGLTTEQITNLVTSDCLSPDDVCKDWIKEYDIIPFVTFGTLPPKLIPAFVAMNCFLWADKKEQWTTLACDLVIAQYDLPVVLNDSSTYPNSTYVYPPALCKNWGKFCGALSENELARLQKDPFLAAYKQSGSTKSIYLTGDWSNVPANTTKIDSSSDWNLLETPAGAILRCGNGTYTAPNKISQASLKFKSKIQAVEINLGAVNIKILTIALVFRASRWLGNGMGSSSRKFNKS